MAGFSRRGFIDGHVHIESAMVTIPEFARATVPKGTTSVVIDPHEIANVWGEEGIYYMLDSSKNVPLNVFLMLPSCVPATSMETSGATLDAETLAKLIDHERVLGLAEVMNFPGVILRDPEVLKKSGWQEESAWTATLRGSPGATWLRISQLASSPTTSARAWKRRRRSCARECIS